jgi:hypothetical protein
MKKLLLCFALFAILSLPAFGQCGPTTTYLGLTLPSHNANGWDTCLNNNSSTLDDFFGGVTTVPAFKAQSLQLMATGTALAVTNNATIGGTLGITGITTFGAGIFGTTAFFSGSVISPSIAVAQDCGTTATCSNTSLGEPYIVTGVVTVSSHNATISGISPAFANTNGRCICSDNTTSSSGCNANINSVSVIGVTAGGTSDNVTYMCVGNQ